MLPTYAELFLRNNISGKILLQLTQEDLRSLGIASFGHVMGLHVRQNTNVINKMLKILKNYQLG